MKEASGSDGLLNNESVKSSFCLFLVFMLALLSCGERNYKTWYIRQTHLYSVSSIKNRLHV